MKPLEAAARAKVIRVRGSDDVPGFEVCVKGAMEEIQEDTLAYLRAALMDEVFIEKLREDIDDRDWERFGSAEAAIQALIDDLEGK